MKLLERWDSKEGHTKLIVQHWYGKRAYYKHVDRAYWRTEAGRSIKNYWWIPYNFNMEDRLESFMVAREVQYCTQVHKIALDKLEGT